MGLCNDDKQGHACFPSFLMWIKVSSGVSACSFRADLPAFLFLFFLVHLLLLVTGIHMRIAVARPYG